MAVSVIEDVGVMQNEIAPTEISGDPTVKGKRKSEKKDRIKYPIPEGGLLAFPPDWKATTHFPLNREDFKDPLPWLEYHRDKTANRLRSLEREIESIKKYGGNPEVVKTMRKLSSDIERLMKSAETLQGFGEQFSPEDLLKDLLQKVGVPQA